MTIIRVQIHNVIMGICNNNNKDISKPFSLQRVAQRSVSEIPYIQYCRTMELIIYLKGIF